MKSMKKRTDRNNGITAYINDSTVDRMEKVQEIFGCTKKAIILKGLELALDDYEKRMTEEENLGVKQNA